jgi:hypothetical protein
MPIRQLIVRTIACDFLWKVELPKKAILFLRAYLIASKGFARSRKIASQPTELGFTNNEQGVAFNQSVRIRALDRIADYEPCGATT